MKFPLLLPLMIMFGFAFTNAQTVTTLINENVGDDMDYARDGFIYTSDYGGEFIRKIDPGAGTFSVILKPSVNTIGAIEVDKNLEIFVTSYDQGWFGSFNEGDASITRHTHNLRGPAGIAFDNDGNRYVTANAAHAIMKLDSNNKATFFARGAPLFWPTGITTDDRNNIYTTNLFNGNIVKTSPQRQSTLLAQLPSVGGNNYILGYLTWHEGWLYVCHIHDHVIYRVNDTTGKFEVLAGQRGNPGNDDGLGSNATFREPTGIDISPNGKALYVTDGQAPNKRLRKIDLNTLHVKNNSFNIVSLSPNPASNDITLVLDKAIGEAQIAIHDVEGRRVEESRRNLTQGENTFVLDQLLSGIYFLTITSLDKRQVMKFVKK